MRSNHLAVSLAALVLTTTVAIGDERNPAAWAGPSEEALAASLPTTQLTFVGILPCRLADTRDLALPPGYGPPTLPAGSPRNFVLTGRCGIPANALAVSANVTAVNPPGPGFLLIRPTDGPNVLVSTLNFIPGQTLANGAVIPLGTGGSAMFLAGVSPTELIIDVNGYYTDGGGGVRSVNALVGDVSLAAGPNVTVTPSGNTLTISASAGGGDITSVTAGSGLSGGGTSGDVTLSVNPSVTQSRINGSCAAGTSIRAVDQAGGVTCEADDSTVYTAGSGLTQAGSTFATDNTLVARKDAAAGNQAFDTSVLYLDYANNRVGMNTTVPATALDVQGTVRATDFTYAAPHARRVVASPTTCIRSSANGGDLHAEMGSVTPPGNPYGPSLISTSGPVNGRFDYYCSIPLDIPATGALTITGATLAYFDGVANCRVQAEIRSKFFGTDGYGAVASTVYDGSNADDFAFINNLPATKAFPAFSLPVSPSQVVWVNATIAFDATGGGSNTTNCRYSGVAVDYTVTNP